MTLNEHLSQVLAIAAEEKRQESVARAEKRKPKLIDQLKDQAKKGSDAGVIIDDDDPVFRSHLAFFFAEQGFSVEQVEPKRLLVTIKTVEVKKSVPASQKQ